MATLRTNLFTSYDLTPEEELAGKQLNTYQIMRLQNLLESKATQKLALPFSPQNPESFMQEEAYLLGQIELIQQLIDESTEN